MPRRQRDGAVIDSSQFVRKVCLSLPETSEVETWGHPSFRAGTRTFAALETVNDRPSIAVRVEPFEAEAFASDERFFATPYGRGKWLSLWLDVAVEKELVRELIVRAYRLVANKRMLLALSAQSQRTAG
jgi:predicted DNA-binding protein (MmcQ/YjbR family)